MAGFDVVVAPTIVIPVGVLPATMRAGVRRQQPTGSLTSQPDSFSAALTRHVVGLAAEAPRRQGHVGQLLSLGSAETAMTMTTNMIASPRNFLYVSAGAWRRRIRRPGRPRRSGLPEHGIEKQPQTRSNCPMPTASHADGLHRSVSQSGAIGGAVLHAARRSTRLSRSELARTLGVGLTTIYAWEAGSMPLYSVPYGVLLDLSQALTSARAQGTGLAELLLASQCDLLIAATLDGTEDYAEVAPLDSDTDGQSARDLLRWALTGTVPEPYCPYAPPHPLLTRRDAARFLTVAEGLARGEQGKALVAFGAALLALADRQATSLVNCQAVPTPKP